jgi:2-isopropylmalate synthase
MKSIERIDTDSDTGRCAAGSGPVSTGAPWATRQYRPFPPIDLADRRWPDRRIERAPIWCSVDLRDGNQALIEPMGVERKRRMFDLLVAMGFKQIEVGFPSASAAEHAFVRDLIEGQRIPDDVTIQVLTPARDELIRATFESLRGVRRAIVHLYNSTSPVQRRVVFGLEKSGITEIARRGANRVRELAEGMDDSDIHFEYSPESFSGTEVDYAVEICEAVMDELDPTVERPLILNLPATVEMSTPNIYADQVELFSRSVRGRDRVVLSVHPHNDRGCAVAAAELALLAGAERIEGTLFGNGERTGNVDVVTLALNLVTQGIDPELDLSDINRLVRVAEHCNRLPVHPRHPYAGDLVFTAFSGSHQDAIQKGLAAQAEAATEPWEVPYLPIDPVDVGRTYEEVIRINSQSGKGGIAFVLEQDHGQRLPRRLQLEFSQVVQRLADASGEELKSEDVWEAFCEEYLCADRPFELLDYRPDYRLDNREAGGPDGQDGLSARIRWQGGVHSIDGRGRGPIDAFVDALHRHCGVSFRISDYREHALSIGADAAAVAYVEIVAADGTALFGVGRNDNIVTASLAAVVSALNRDAARIQTLRDEQVPRESHAPVSATAR